MMSDDLFKRILYDAIFNNIIVPVDTNQIPNKTYREMEHNCKTTVTDQDMLKLHVDIALQNGNKEEFMRLTEQLAVTQ